MRRLVKILLVYITLLFAVLLIISQLTVFISPEKCWWLAIFGLFYPFILMVNMVFIIFWLIKKNYYFLIPLLIILLGWGNLRNTFQFGFHKKNKKIETDITLLSYNVRLFNYYNWLNDNSTQDKILAYIAQENPNIICFQEFFTQEKGDYSTFKITEILKETNLSHILYTSIDRNNSSYGIATFTSLPIINKGYVRFKNSMNTAIYTDLIYKEDTLRIYNLHLQSIHLNKSNYSYLDSLFISSRENHISEIKDISYHLKDAYIKRARQVDILSQHINNSPYPVLVCGDFNDIPVSYTYRKLKGPLKDAFLSSNIGLGATYKRNMQSFRIDYIFHYPHFKSISFRTEKVNWSDHFPVISEISIRRMK